MNLLWLLGTLAVVWPTGPTASSQPLASDEVWETLAQVEWRLVKRPNQSKSERMPIFTPAIKRLEGDTLTLRGNYIGLTLNDSSVVLIGGPSAFVYSEWSKPDVHQMVQVSLSAKLPTDYPSYPKAPVALLVRGVMRLNDTDPKSMIYTLENAEILAIEER